MSKDYAVLKPNHKQSSSTKKAVKRLDKRYQSATGRGRCQHPDAKEGINPPDFRYLSFQRSGNYEAVRVQVTGDSKKPVFRFSKYGGKEGAVKAARAYRDKTCKKLGISIGERFLGATERKREFPRKRKTEVQDAVDSVGYRVYTRRVELNATRVELAEASRTNLTTIYDIECGESKYPRNIYRIALSLGINPAWAQFGDEWADPDLPALPRGRRQTTGVRLRSFRENLGLSRVDLAAISGVSVSHIYYLEHSKGKDGTSRIEPLAKALGVNPAWLQFGEPFAKPKREDE